MAHFKVRVVDNSLLFLPRADSGDGTKYALTVRLHRTLRIPNDGKTYPLPPSLGRFPVKKVDDYKDKVPKSWLEHGGVFVPMYQREALWLSFSARHWSPVAVKVAAGLVNAVSGEVWHEKLESSRDGKQDYMVAPPQPWLDGFNTGRDEISQFVAMPLGQGYTVEGQLTGEEKFGGIQIVVFDAKDGKFPSAEPVERGWQAATFMDFECSEAAPVAAAAPYGAGRVGGQSMTKSAWSVGRRRGTALASRDVGAAEMGLAAGGKMDQKIYPDPHGVDTWDETKSGRVFIHTVNSVMWEQITGEPAPATPIDVATYERFGYPWFSLYDEHLGDVSAPEKLKQVKSIAEIDAEKGDEVRDGAWTAGPDDHAK